MGTPSRDETFRQDVAAVNFNTNIANAWVKPIGIAFGVEHWRESISGYAAPYSQENWISGNFMATNGHDTVTEGYLEALVPLPTSSSTARRVSPATANQARSRRGRPDSPGNRSTTFVFVSPARATSARPILPSCSRPGRATPTRWAIPGTIAPPSATPSR
jgi:hypothetical protein